MRWISLISALVLLAPVVSAYDGIFWHFATGDVSLDKNQLNGTHVSCLDIIDNTTDVCSASGGGGNASGTVTSVLLGSWILNAGSSITTTGTVAVNGTAVVNAIGNYSAVSNLLYANITALNTTKANAGTCTGGNSTHYNVTANTSASGAPTCVMVAKTGGGSSSDGNNYTTNATFNSSNLTVQLNIERAGMTNLTPTFTVPAATTSQWGAVQLFDGVTSTSTLMAATANIVKFIYDSLVTTNTTLNTLSTTVTSLSNWTFDRPNYVNLTTGDSRYGNQSGNATCTGTNNFTVSFAFNRDGTMNTTQCGAPSGFLTSAPNSNLTSIAVTGTTTKTLQANQTNGVVLNASWTDIDTTYTAGNGLTLTGTVFSENDTYYGSKNITSTVFANVFQLPNGQKIKSNSSLFWVEQSNGTILMQQNSSCTTLFSPNGATSVGACN